MPEYFYGGRSGRRNAQRAYEEFEKRYRQPPKPTWEGYNPDISKVKYNRLPWKELTEIVTYIKGIERVATKPGNTHLQLFGPCGDMAEIPMNKAMEVLKDITSVHANAIIKARNNSEEEGMQHLAALLIEWAMKECLICTPIEICEL